MNCGRVGCIEGLAQLQHAHVGMDQLRNDCIYSMNLHEVPALPERDGLPPPPKRQRLLARMAGVEQQAQQRDWAGNFSAEPLL